MFRDEKLEALGISNAVKRCVELEEAKDKLYKGLYQWLLENKDYLQEQLINDSAICGEWLGMGKLKYDVGEFDKKWYMFVKANIDDEYNLYNLIYDHELFKYPFLNQEIPNFIGIVPEITELMVLPTKEFLDSIYETYTNGVKRDVEGFVVNYKNIISKYVRMKNGKLEEHFDRGE